MAMHVWFALCRRYGVLQLVSVAVESVCADKVAGQLGIITSCAARGACAFVQQHLCNRSCRRTKVIPLQTSRPWMPGVGPSAAERQ